MTALATAEHHAALARDIVVPSLLARRLERSLAIWHKIHGTEDHPDVATSLHELGVVLYAQVLADAGIRFEPLDILQKIHGTQDHPAVATTYAGLGNCLRDLELLDDSERAFRTALHIREQVFETRDHYMYAETEFMLAVLVAQRGRVDEAGALLQHAVAVLQAQVPNHSSLTMLRDAATQPAHSE